MRQRAVSSQREEIADVFPDTSYREPHREPSQVLIHGLSFEPKEVYRERHTRDVWAFEPARDEGRGRKVEHMSACVSVLAICMDLWTCNFRSHQALKRRLFLVELLMISTKFVSAVRVFRVCLCVYICECHLAVLMAHQ